MINKEHKEVIRMLENLVYIDIEELFDEAELKDGGPSLCGLIACAG